MSSMRRWAAVLLPLLAAGCFAPKDLEVEVSPADTRVVLDGQALKGNRHYRLPLSDAREHLLMLSRPGYRTREIRLAWDLYDPPPAREERNRLDPDWRTGPAGECAGTCLWGFKRTLALPFAALAHGRWMLREGDGRAVPLADAVRLELAPEP